MSRKVLKIGCKVTMVSSARSTVVVLVVGLVTAPVVAPQIRWANWFVQPPFG